MNRFDQILSALVGDSRTSSTPAQRWIEMGSPTPVYRPVEWDRVSAAVVDRTGAAPEIRLYSVAVGATAVFLRPVPLNSSSGGGVLNLIRADRPRWIEAWPLIGNDYRPPQEGRAYIDLRFETGISETQLQGIAHNVWLVTGVDDRASVAVVEDIERQRVRQYMEQSMQP